MTKVQIGNNSMELPEGPIGLSFSTGLDSTILLYLLAQQVKSDLHLFTISVHSRDLHAIKYSADILNWVIAQTGKTNIYLHVTVKQDADDALGNAGLYKTPAEYLARGLINCVVTGHNSLPPDEIDLGWPAKDSHDYKIRTPHEQRDIEFATNWFSPLTNCNKKQIAELFLENGALALAKKTNSCYTSYNEEPCKQCFACKEKFWGFGFY